MTEVAKCAFESLHPYFTVPVQPCPERNGLTFDPSFKHACHHGESSWLLVSFVFQQKQLGSLEMQAAFSPCFVFPACSSCRNVQERLQVGHAGDAWLVQL